MLKRLMACIVAVAAFALLATEADAGCYTKSGRTYCTSTQTGSIVLKEAWTGCDPLDEDGCDSQSFSALTSNSIAFCSNPNDPDGLPPIRTTCIDEVTFGGPLNECVFQPPSQRNKIPGGGFATGHKCTGSTKFEPQGGCEDECEAAAGVGSTVLDIVPIDVDTQVIAFFGGIASAASSTTECPADPCQIEEHCTISPSRIAFEAIRTYTCETTSVGAPPVPGEICDNGQDDDGDDKADCGDPDCQGFPGCPEIVCDDVVDNDEDGLTDCADPDCFSASCAPELECSDFFDNDADGLTDCADPDCAGGSCLPG